MHAGKAAMNELPFPSPRRIVLRVVFMAVCLAAWFATQSFIGRRAFREDGIGDLVH